MESRRDADGTGWRAAKARWLPPLRPIGTLAVGAVLLAACTSAASLTTIASAGPTTPTTSDATATGATTAVAPLVDRRVFVEGDSLMVGVQPYLPDLLVPTGRLVTFDAQIGRTTDEGILSFAEQRPSEIGGTIVVGLGTNDVADPVTFAARIDQLMILASGRSVIWITVARWGWSSLDRALLAAQTRWANLRVIDWRPVIAAYPYFLGADGIHLTDAGYQLRAQFIAAAVESLS